MIYGKPIIGSLCLVLFKQAFSPQKTKEHIIFQKAKSLLLNIHLSFMLHLFIILPKEPLFYYSLSIIFFNVTVSLIILMNQYEVNKLKKQLQRSQDVIEELRNDLEFTEKKLTEVQAERDRYHSEILMMRESIENVDGAISHKIQEIKLQERKNFVFKLQEYEKLKSDFDLEKNLKQKLVGDIQIKDATISELSTKLREMARKHGDHTAISNPAHIKDNIAMNTAQYYKLTEKYNKLASDMENVIAENRILRKLHGVPDNFGFDLQEIKVAEKQELQDYKTQVKHLQAELQELQSERTQLRYRLRQYSSLYSNKGERYKDFTPEQFQLLDAYALNLRQGNIQLPQLDKSKKQMQKQIIKLRAQLQIFQGRMPRSESSLVGTGDVKKYHDQVKGLLSPLLDGIQKALSKQSTINNFNSSIHNVNNNIKNTQIKSPIPLPAPTNDWQNMEQGLSYTLNSKIPLDLKQLYGETGFNIVQAKYEVGLLQLHNIQNMKIIKEKQRIQRELLKQIAYLKDEYKKFMLLQDDVVIKHFQFKEQMNSKLGTEKNIKAEVESERDQFRKKVQIMEDSYRTLMNKSPSQLQTKVIQLTKRLAISQAETLKSQRKYKIINQQQLSLRKNYNQLQQKSADSESSLREKLLVVKRNQDLLSQTLNTVLQDSRDNISVETHTIVRNKLQILQDKYANTLLKEADLRKKVATLEGADRASHLKQKTIDTLRDDNSDLILELQVVKCRLSALDPQFRSYEQTFSRFIKFVMTNNISTLTFFKKFDKSGDGLLQKDEFRAGLSALGFNIENQEFNLLYSFIDLDGSGQINYKQFLKKLRRSGVQMRTQQQTGVMRLYQAITDKNFTLKRAFQAIDTDNSNMISKGQMQQAMLRIGIPITADTVEYIFRMVDTDMDGTINYNQFQKIFVNIIGQSQVQQKTLFNTSLDWKYAVMLKIDECAVKNNMTVIQAFQLLDPDGSRQITINQLKTFFVKAGIEISNNNIMDLFRMLDRDQSKSIKYDQFLDFIREAKKEKERIDRIQYVKNRELEIRRQHSIHNQFDSRITEEATLRGKLMALELKQTHFSKKHELLVKQLARRQADIKDLKDALELNQKSILKVQQDFYIEKQKNINLQQKSKGALSVKEVDRLKSRYNHEHIENAEVKTQLQFYKGLSQIIQSKTRQYKRNLDRIEQQKEKFYQLVKQFQSGSDTNALVGKLTIQLQQIKYQYGAQQERSQKVAHQSKDLKAENLKLTKDMESKQKEIINTHLFFREKSAIQQRNIDELSGKILPTITLAKVQGLAIKLRELSQGRSELQDQNRKLRQINFELQLRNDYLQSEKENIEQLQVKLRRLYAGDENAITIIDLSKKLTQYKMVELKCKRQTVLMRQKQDYYTRIHHTNQDIIKELQQQVSKWQTKFALSEDSWRKKLSDQAKLAEGLRLENAKQKQQEDNFFTRRNQQIQANRQLQKKLSSIDQGRLKKMNVSQLSRDPTIERRLIDVERENDQLRQKLQDILSVGKNIPHMVDYSVQGSQIMSQSINMQTDLTVSQLKNNANRFIKTAQNREQFFQHESSKLAQAAQQSIATLQSIIDDKNQQIRRKDKLIQDLKNDFLRTKEEDTLIIQQLNQKLSKNMNNTDDGMGDTYMRQTTRIVGRKPTQAKFNELQRELEQKDRRLRELEYHNQTQFATSTKFKGDDELDRLKKKIRDLQNQKQMDEKAFKQIQADLKRRIAALEKLSKQKDAKLAKLQKSLAEIKSDVLGEKQKQQKTYENLQSKVSSHNPNNSQLETHLQEAVKTIRSQKSQIEDLGSKLKTQDQIIVNLKNQMLSKNSSTGTAMKRPSSVKK